MNQATASSTPVAASPLPADERRVRPLLRSLFGTNPIERSSGLSLPWSRVVAHAVGGENQQLVEALLLFITLVEWDNPAMTEFKRLEAEERVMFDQSHTHEEWLAALGRSTLRDEPIKLAPKTPSRFPFKPLRLPW